MLPGMVDLLSDLDLSSQLSLLGAYHSVMFQPENHISAGILGLDSVNSRWDHEGLQRYTKMEMGSGRFRRLLGQWLAFLASFLRVLQNRVILHAAVIADVFT